VLILILIVLAITFGGFQKGTKANSLRYYQPTGLIATTQISRSAGQIWTI
jgi:hypothetical protein